MTRTLTVMVCLGGLLLSAPVASADMPDLKQLRAQGAQQVLVAADRRHNNYKTRQMKLNMVLKPVSGESRTFVYAMWEKRRKLRLVRFLGPGEVKGLSILVRGASTMYVYSPQTDNVRRVATHARRQTFMGSDLTFDDMAQIDYSNDYAAVEGKETATHLWLKLTKKAGSKQYFKRLDVRLDKTKFLLDKILYYEGSRVIRKQERSKAVLKPGYTAYHRLTVTDMASRHRTTVNVLESRVNTTIPDSKFSKRSLVRGH